MLKVATNLDSSWFWLENVGSTTLASGQVVAGRTIHQLGRNPCQRHYKLFKKHLKS